jgi:flavin-dependent dehydrogenase
MTTETEYDIIVVGAGCAGLAAALFAALAGLRALVIERHVVRRRHHGAVCRGDLDSEHRSGTNRQSR